ncbi:putative 1-acyl-sn-glycerol-3-phosphate acyltransferase 5 [Hordeum vulgare]|nr:putative 1-acyl-sn-glycerol-3-phosphate acyltransferase 5 [Hordeum vulgare]
MTRAFDLASELGSIRVEMETDSQLSGNALNHSAMDLSEHVMVFVVASTRNHYHFMNVSIHESITHWPVPLTCSFMINAVYGITIGNCIHEYGQQYVIDPSDVHIHKVITQISDIPTREDEVSDWITERFRLKDELLSDFSTLAHSEIHAEGRALVQLLDTRSPPQLRDRGGAAHAQVTAARCCRRRRYLLHAKKLLEIGIVIATVVMRSDAVLAAPLPWVAVAKRGWKARAPPRVVVEDDDAVLLAEWRRVNA